MKRGRKEMGTGRKKRDKLGQTKMKGESNKDKSR